MVRLALAESIALRNRQPLVSLTISEIGIQEKALEAALVRCLSVAQKWRAIVLIDECDIFLEQRERKDIARNGIVPGESEAMPTRTISQQPD